MSAVGVQRPPSPSPPLPPSTTRPGLTSAAPGLPPARLPTASCARRSSSKTGSDGRPRRRPRPRAAGLAGPMSRPLLPHVPCTPRLARPGPSGDRSSQRRRRRLLPPPPGCAGAASPAPRRPRLRGQDNSAAAVRRVGRLGSPAWELREPPPLGSPGGPPLAKAQPGVRVNSWPLGIGEIRLSPLPPTVSWVLLKGCHNSGSGPLVSLIWAHLPQEIGPEARSLDLQLLTQGP